MLISNTQKIISFLTQEVDIQSSKGPPLLKICSSVLLDRVIVHLETKELWPQKEYLLVDFVIQRTFVVSLFDVRGGDGSCSGS